MAVTKRADLFIPEVLAEAVRGEIAGAQALYGTGAAVSISQGFPEEARGGDTITIPYFGHLGEFEDLASDEGGVGAVPALTPAKLTQSSETAAVKHSGKAFETTAWAEMAAAYEDPYAEAARQIRQGLERRADRELITVAEATTLSRNVYNATTPVKLNWEEAIKTRYLWNDEQAEIAAIVVHSKTAQDLELQKDADGRPLMQQNVVDGRVINMLGGIPLIISDRLTTTPNAGGASTPTSYTSLVVKRNALAFWFNGGLPDIQEDRDILADTRVAALHVYFAAHRYLRTPGATLTGVAKIVHN